MKKTLIAALVVIILGLAVYFSKSYWMPVIVPAPTQEVLSQIDVDRIRNEMDSDIMLEKTLREYYQSQQEEQESIETKEIEINNTSIYEMNGLYGHIIDIKKLLQESQEFIGGLRPCPLIFTYQQDLYGELSCALHKDNIANITKLLIEGLESKVSIYGVSGDGHYRGINITGTPYNIDGQDLLIYATPTTQAVGLEIIIQFIKDNLLYVCQPSSNAIPNEYMDYIDAQNLYIKSIEEKVFTNKDFETEFYQYIKDCTNSSLGELW